MRYFRKFESFQPHPDYPCVDANVRGKTGPVQVGFFNTVSVWCDHFIRACLSAGIPANPDFNGAELNPNGVGRVSIFVVTTPPAISPIRIAAQCVHLFIPMSSLNEQWN